MANGYQMTATYGREWRRSATEDDLASAVAHLELLVATAREAGRPVTATAILHEARDIEAQRKRQLDRLVNSSRDRVPNQVDESGERTAGT